MLYIFHVDTGTTITFDIKLALQSVSQLKEAIERECGVVAAHQVLLMSGGESLEPNARVCSYSAGTDTNPIYLFSKAAIESHHPPTPSIDYGSDVDLQSQIDASLAMPATYHTLVARAQLAQQCCGLAREQTRICERLVHDQHLQQQGWAAVVANLEDITQMFQSRADLLHQSFSLYLAERQQHMELLDNFSNDLGTLSKIPILPALRAQAEGFLSLEEMPSEEESPSSDKVLSLLKWISAKDNQSSLEQVAEQCSRGLEQFDERVMEALKTEVNAAVEAANKQDMKEIKGLGERLFALEQLMAQTKKLVQEQGELAQGFLQNQNRANNLGDASVLPDLCMSHRRQLLVMLQNHNQLRDIRRRCTKAKEELSVNIYHRLKWITYVENKMMEVDGKLVMYHESLKRLRRHLEVLQQIHLAPQMYMNAVAEVVRRRIFSQAFLVWASNLACQLLTVHSDELARRREFQNKFEGHFLNTLFPGLEDTPPPFATQAPSVFDADLPKLTVEDMNSLKEQIPDLALALSAPDLDGITRFFLSKSLTEDGSEDKKDKNTDEAAKDQEREGPPTLGDRGGFESETDTEEFEKISQATADSKLTSYESGKQRRQKPLEVGRSSSPSSSTSTNASPISSKIADPCLNRSSSSSEPGSFHFPSLSGERPTQLSPLAECAENPEASSRANDRSRTRQNPTPSSTFPPNRNPDPVSTTRPVCDGEQLRQGRASGSPGSSPGVSNAADFVGTEFYMDESLPSSLSEHPEDSQHQAIFSLLQENLGNTRGEVERLQGLLRTTKAVACETLPALREELAAIRESTNLERKNFNEMVEKIRRALDIQSEECMWAFRKFKQDFIIDHERELEDLEETIRSREEEIRTMKQTILEKDTELSEHQRMVGTIRQNLEAEQAEVQKLQSCLGSLNVALEQAKEDKINAIKEANEAHIVEVFKLKESLFRRSEKVQELEASLVAARADQEKMVKEATDKLLIDYKLEVPTILSRFKLMEKSFNEASMDKMERSDVIERANHEAIIAQLKEDMNTEKSQAIVAAIEKERSKCAAKLDHELKIARERNDAERQAILNQAVMSAAEEKDRMDLQELRVTTLTEECEKYRDTIRRLTESESLMKQSLGKKIKSLEADKLRLESKMAAEWKILEQRESRIRELEAERGRLRQVLSEKRQKASQAGPGLEETLKGLGAEKDQAELEMHSNSDEAEVSESKKVRLEAAGDPACLSRKLEALEADNKRLNAELKSIREAQETAEAKVMALEDDKVRLEIELVKERSRRDLVADGTPTSATEGRDKEMSASVSVIFEPSVSKEPAIGSELARGEDPASARSHFFMSPILVKAMVRNRLANLPDYLFSFGRVNFTRCNPGDIVSVYWDALHENYTILLDTITLYFMNPEAMPMLELQAVPGGPPVRLATIGEVVSKEYCHAKKSGNRYKVPQGTKFFRVRLKPVTGNLDHIEAVCRSIEQ
ncbi:RB1-inducible coiled-coil protein 1 isoform X1 [Orussus abietinus]|uniref:RB1-inducible coiled-coil protein 1 isoform X1 n=1 Tax=Orussus abietinus TaxID=222816 RepID=UPI0006261253|nr:RB1-inducible coiled-coil protein 1 isoform X1 [Orussus abietinus]XP_012289129.1 RB1-inducible coiled-coil protein 1 isoform X1 [Orussus abietinus]